MTGPKPPTLADLVFRPGGLVLPVVSYPGTQLTGATVLEMVREPSVQADCILAVHREFRTEVLGTSMDLSLEAEAFGAQVRFGPDEIPQVIGRRISSEAEARDLEVPPIGMARTAIQLDVIRRLATAQPGRLILAGVTGPFSLAARLLGISEALVLTHDAPDLVRNVVARCTEFLAAYLIALRRAGAGGVFMAEPTAGLLSPNGMALFSSSAVAELLKPEPDPAFSLILHCCAARVAHLPALLASGARALHFGAPMDIATALERLPGGTLVAGNIDPATFFVNGTAAMVAEAVRDLRHRTRGHPNFVLSSGCDLPARTPLANLEAFFRAAAESPPR